MTANHGDGSVPGRKLGEPDALAQPRFDVVVRGYDRRQVDEHIASLERTLARQRSELEQARVKGASGGPPLFPGGPRSGGAEGPGGLTPEMIGAFTTRLQSILQAAEEEAEEVRTNARNYARQEEEVSRARLADLERRRDSVLDNLKRVRAQLDGLLAEVGAESGAGGPGTPAQGAAAGSARAESVVRRKEPSGEPGGPSPAPRPDAQVERDTAPPRPRPTPSPGPKPPGPSASPPPSPTPGPKTPSPTPQGSSSHPGMPPRPGAPGPHPKPRPTPSPRPRAGVPSPVQGPQEPGRGGEQHARNGVINRDNGAPGRGDESDGGRSAFGTGAR